MEKITVQFANPLLNDRLHTLAAEYSVPAGVLISIAVKHLLDDVNLLRDLRAGKVNLE